MLDRVLAINVKLIFYITRAVLPVLLAKTGGVILKIGSTASIHSWPSPRLTTVQRQQGRRQPRSKSIAIELASDEQPRRKRFYGGQAAGKRDCLVPGDAQCVRSGAGEQIARFGGSHISGIRAPWAGTRAAAYILC